MSKPPHLANRGNKDAGSPAAAGDAASPKKIRIPTMLWGATLVTAGLIFLLDQIGIFDRRLVYEWWPVVLIAFGIYSRGHFFTAIGTWLLIAKLELFGLTYSTAWPVILVMVGAGIIVDSFRRDGGSRCGAFSPGGDDR
ncbi:MAG: hypothetical protein KY432_09270 [Acidobacteria bacterium]|nr:hypothetical protein [Acidobacteriota bacterium]